MKYSVNLLYVGMRGDSSSPLWEERIILVEALDEDEATNKAMKFAKAQEANFHVDSSTQVSWTFKQIERVFLIDEPLDDGCELFSRFLRQSEVDSILTPFDD